MRVLQDQILYTDLFTDENRVALAEVLIERCAKYYAIVCKQTFPSDANPAASRTKLEHEYVLQRLHLVCLVPGSKSSLLNVLGMEKRSAGSCRQMVQ